MYVNITHTYSACMYVRMYVYVIMYVLNIHV